MPNWYAINHPTILHTHNETVTHCCLLMALCAAGCILQAKLLSASSVRKMIHCEVKYSRPLDLKSSSIVNLPFAWIREPATELRAKSLLP